MEHFDLPFPHSTEYSASDKAQTQHVTTLPVRLSRYRNAAINGASNASQRWLEHVGSEAAWVVSLGLGSQPGHLVSWAFPECPPNLTEKLAEVMESMAYWDEIADSMSPSTLQDYTDDANLALVSTIKLGDMGPVKYAPTRFVVSAITEFLKDNTSSFERVMKIKSTIETGHDTKGEDMSLEEFKDHRAVNSAALIALELLRTYHNISITEEEADSVWHFLKKGARSSALLNDLYSFHKELQDHARNGSTSNMRNTVAFLIQKHGTTEDEAFGLIKEDVLREEKELMDAYRMWQASRAYKSQDLQKYVVLAILYFGGLSYWQAISPRYKQQNDSSGNNGGLSMNKESLRCQQDYHPVHADSLKALPASHDGLESMGSISNTSGNDSLEGDAMNYLNEPLQKARAEEVCMGPYLYTKALPGKNTVARVTEGLQLWINLPTQALGMIKDACEMTFTATLMLDDIEDGSQLRRGRPAAHMLFGQAQTINSANYTFFRGLTQLQHLGNAKLCETFSEGLQVLSLGQALELHWRDGSICPNVDEYMTMVDSKTGGFFRLVAQLMAVAAGWKIPSCLAELITVLGRYYQIRDDYQNLISDEYTSTKGFCDDLDEGKFSLLVIHLLESSSHAERIRALLLRRSFQKSMEPELKRWILSEMRLVGTFEYVFQRLTELHHKLLGMLDGCERELGPNKRLRFLILSLKI